MASVAAGLPDNRILDALAVLQADDDRDELVLPAYSIKALAPVVGASIANTALALGRLITAGKVTTRKHRSGETLYKLVDQHHMAWVEQRVL